MTKEPSKRWVFLCTKKNNLKKTTLFCLRIQKSIIFVSQNN